MLICKHQWIAHMLQNIPIDSQELIYKPQETDIQKHR
jgi:hypothetical protein